MRCAETACNGDASVVGIERSFARSIFGTPAGIKANMVALAIRRQLVVATVIDARRLTIGRNQDLRRTDRSTGAKHTRQHNQAVRYSRTTAQFRAYENMANASRPGAHRDALSYAWRRFRFLGAKQTSPAQARSRKPLLVGISRERRSPTLAETGASFDDPPRVGVIAGPTQRN